MQLYKFTKAEVLEVNNMPNRLAIPGETECIVISTTPDFHVLQIVSPRYLNRFQVRLPKDKIDVLVPSKTPTAPIYMQRREPSGDVVCKSCGKKLDYGKVPETSMGAIKCPHCKSVIDQTGKVLAQVIQPFRKQAIPEFSLGEWYTVPGFDYPLIRFDGYDNGLYTVTVPGKSGKGLIQLNIDENDLRKYEIQPACECDFVTACPGGQCSLKTKKVVKV